MNRRLFFSLPNTLCVAALLALATVRPAHAQTAPSAEAEKVQGKIYTYVEQMPQMPGGGGNRAIVEAIQSKLIYPAEALKNNIQGRVFVSFVVGEDGAVREPKVVKGIGGGCDEAVLASVQQLPRFTPGTQAGRPVSVSFTVPVTFQVTAPAPKPAR